MTLDKVSDVALFWFKSVWGNWTILLQIILTFFLCAMVCAWFHNINESQITNQAISTYFNSSTLTTSKIDDLAEQGVFTGIHSTLLCSSSRYVLLSGYYHIVAGSSREHGQIFRIIIKSVANKRSSYLRHGAGYHILVWKMAFGWTGSNDSFPGGQLHRSNLSPDVSMTGDCPLV